jgi:hypothetical protein
MDSSGLKRAIAALALGGAVVALGGTAAEIVSAQTAQQTPPASPTAPATPRGPRQDGLRQDGPRQGGPQEDGQRQAREQQFLAALAAKLNVTPERLQQAIAETRQQLGIPDRAQGGPERGGPGRGPGFSLDAAAQALGISPDQLRQELPGKSLADVARAHNVAPTTVANALKAAATTHIDQDVSSGRLTADQAAQIKQGLDERINQQLNRQVPTGGPANAPTRGGPRPSGDSRTQPAL